MLTTTEVARDQACSSWDRYVLSHPGGSGYHLMAWRRVMADAFAHETFYLMVTDEDQIVRGVLPLVFLSSRLFGRLLVSMPYVNYGGLLAHTIEAQDALLNSAVDLAKEQGATHIELRQSETLGFGWPVKQHKVSMRLELPKHFETLWEGFPSKLRSQVRRARKAGMIVRFGGEELLDDFYRLLARNMRDLGSPVHARGMFESFLQVLPDETRVCVVSMAGEPMAAGFLYGFREVLEIPWASADRRYKELSSNMLLYSAALEYGCGAGYRAFDFGRSTPGSGTYHFKQQWGATPFPLHWYYWLSNGGPLPEISPQNPKFRLAIEVWKRLPVSITRIVGPAIVRNIP
jgi:serine/alanine adding enzyme